MLLKDTLLNLHDKIYIPKSCSYKMIYWSEGWMNKWHVLQRLSKYPKSSHAKLIAFQWKSNNALDLDVNYLWSFDKNIYSTTTLICYKNMNFTLKLEFSPRINWPENHWTRVQCFSNARKTNGLVSVNDFLNQQKIYFVNNALLIICTTWISWTWKLNIHANLRSKEITNTI